MKIAIYTAICGDKSILLDPPVIHKDIDYIAFTDQIGIKFNVWNIKPIIPFSIDSIYNKRRNAKVFKILPEMFLNDYDVTIWHDGGHYCHMHPLDIIKTYMPNAQDDLAIFKHRWNTCVYKEAHDIKREKLDRPDIVDQQMIYYKLNSYPENNGLYETPVIIRKKSASNALINLRWWEQICKYSSRDQLSFPVVLWSLNKIPIILPGNGNGFYQNNIVPHYKI